MTACILLSILSIRFWRVSAAIPFQSSSTLSHNSCTPLGGVGCLCKACLRLLGHSLIGGLTIPIPFLVQLDKITLFFFFF